MDTAFPKVATHPELHFLFRGHSLDSQVRQRQLVIEFLCQETGGPCVYLGRDMITVHEGLGITGAHWATFHSILQEAARDLELSPEATETMLAVFEAQASAVAQGG